MTRASRAAGAGPPRQERDYTIIVVTHNMQQAARVSGITVFLTLSGPRAARRMVEASLTRNLFGNPAERPPWTTSPGKGGITTAH